MIINLRLELLFRESKLISICQKSHMTEDNLFILDQYSIDIVCYSLLKYIYLSIDFRKYMYTLRLFIL